MIKIKLNPKFTLKIKILYFFILIVRLNAATYYVATSGNDANSGASTSSPFRTIQKGAAVARAGDTVMIRGGTYRETIIPANSGTASSPIKFRSS